MFVQTEAALDATFFYNQSSIMAITDIRLQNFRSYEDDFFELSSGVNIIVGPNASGKTNLLEAVLVLARGGSYRAKDAELVRFDAEWARLDAHDDAGKERTVKIQRQPAGTYKKSFEIEEKVYLRLSQQKMLPLVLFEPNHLLMLSGSPELRRSYLDDLLEQTVPGFGTTRRQYRRVLAQRNALLKQGLQVAQPQMFVWNVRLSELAGQIVRERLGLLERINNVASSVYGGISDNAESEVRLEYATSLPQDHYESALLKKYEHSLERDSLLGFTTAGPHRDDLEVYLNGHPSQESASRGESRTIILTLKVIELQLIESSREQSPILLLDDVFSELDGRRRHALTNFLQSYQTFITTTDADVVVKHFMDACNIIPTVREDASA
jgi:DNA replication and repair protein RecF